jgi:hypothetical protein
MTALDILNSKKVFLSDMVTSSKGSKTILITDATKNPVVWQPQDWLRIPFEPGAFNDPAASRQSISFTPTDAMETQLRDFDEACIAQLAQSSVKYFGADLTESAIRERFQSSLKVSTKGYKSMKLKVNVSGRGVVQCYDTTRTPIEQPASWVCHNIRPRVTLKGLWMFSRQIGALFELTACQLEEEGTIVAECPF